MLELILGFASGILTFFLILSIRKNNMERREEERLRDDRIRYVQDDNRNIREMYYSLDRRIQTLEKKIADTPKAVDLIYESYYPLDLRIKDLEKKICFLL